MAAGAYSLGKTEESTVACESVASTDELPPIIQSARTWGNDSIREQEKRGDWQTDVKWKVRWTWNIQHAWLRMCHYIKSAMTAFITLPIWKWTPWTKKHLFAIFLVLIAAITPLCVLGKATSPYSNSPPFSGVFMDKVISCGGSLGGRPQNSTVTGIEKLFVLDTTFGNFSFSQAKTIDILWDLAVGRGLQLLAWWAAYIVFCDALLKAIERHPSSFAIFQRIALEGPGVGSLWTLTVELWAAKSRRTKALFVYMFWSTAYVLILPIVLGAMTGYDSTSVAWVDLEGSNNIIPASALTMSWIVEGTVNETWAEPGCMDDKLSDKYNWITSRRRYECECQISNGTTYSGEQLDRMLDYNTYNPAAVLPSECIYNFPNNTKTWEDWDFPIQSKRITYSCNSTFPVTIKGKTYDVQDLKTDRGWCYDSVGYNFTSLLDKSRCLPDTANRSYEWGFSTLLSGLFVFVTAGWVLSMYVLWLDAQHGSTLVRQGYRMTPLRAAFAMAKAARQRTGLGEKQLLRVDTSVLEKELYGGKRSKKTKVEYTIFVEDPEEGDESEMGTL